MRNMNDINIVVAVDEGGGFGKAGKIPWNEPEDLKHFKEVTKDSICIMGRRTYEDMVEMRKGKKIGKSILPGRECYVLTRDNNADFEGATIASGLRDVLDKIKDTNQKPIFVIGGEKLFIEALSWAKRVHMTVVEGDHKCDKFFPIDFLRRKFKIVSGEKKGNLTFVEYIRT